jgi:YD repeat-containing protein
LNLLAQTNYGYDENNGSPQGVHGNQTSITRWLNTGQSPKSQTIYNANGMPSQYLDPLTYRYQYGYDCSGSLLNSVTNPLNQTASAQHDCNTGLANSITDANNQTTSYWYDSLRRTTTIQYPPDGGSTIYGYSDDSGSPPPFSVTDKQQIGLGVSPKVQTSQLDLLGRVVQAQLNSDPDGTDFTDTSYDGLGRVYSVSNPHRGGSNPTDGQSTYTYDGLSRKTVQQNPDGTMKQWCYDGLATTGQSNCHAHIASGISEWVDVADENGNDWQYSYDALGHLTSVIEPNPAGGAGSAPAMETDYNYDALGNLLSIVQWGGASGTSGAVRRSFTYDSLSRLLTSTNPETGTICYGLWSGTNCGNGYDANGNLRYKTDARGVTVNYLYDALNRLTSKTYSGDNSASLVLPVRRLATCNAVLSWTFDESMDAVSVIGQLYHRLTRKRILDAPFNPCLRHDGPHQERAAMHALELQLRRIVFSFVYLLPERTSEHLQ